MYVYFFFQNDMLNDVFNPFIMEVRVSAQQQAITQGDGNQTLEDFSSSPVVSQSGATQVQVHICTHTNL